jgi:hypothetical protein
MWIASPSRKSPKIVSSCEERWASSRVLIRSGAAIMFFALNR